ncbi:MAG: hypothetical protein H6831_01550 [Planctomycetes bacterium]|nr:hypothetical protein [Planctomycetota bacterium]MCB9903071.1 hypothetical protein [Planctomycetota bacterium]
MKPTPGFALRLAAAACVAVTCGCHAFSSLDVYAGDDARIFARADGQEFELRCHEGVTREGKAPIWRAIEEGERVRPERLRVVRASGEELFWYVELDDAYESAETATRYPVVSLDHFHNGLVDVFYDYLDLGGGPPPLPTESPRE